MIDYHFFDVFGIADDEHVFSSDLEVGNVSAFASDSSESVQRVPEYLDLELTRISRLEFRRVAGWLLHDQFG